MTDGQQPPLPTDQAPDVRARRLVQRAAADPRALDPEAVLQRVCRAAVLGLSMHGAVVHLATSTGMSGVVAGSDEASRRFADLAFTTGEGPTVDALGQRRPVLVADLARGPRRWPAFEQEALAAGVPGVFSVPFQVGGATMGVLELHGDRARALSQEELDLIISLARLAAQALLGSRPGSFPDAGWEPLIDHRAEVYQAQGMVMVDLGVDLGEALLRMRAFAYAEGIALIDLAKEIIGGFVLPVGGEQV